MGWSTTMRFRITMSSCRDDVTEITKIQWTCSAAHPPPPPAPGGSVSRMVGWNTVESQFIVREKTNPFGLVPVRWPLGENGVPSIIRDLVVNPKGVKNLLSRVPLEVMQFSISRLRNSTVGEQRWHSTKHDIVSEEILHVKLCGCHHFCLDGGRHGGI